jgi:hypothetical protein
MMGRLCPHDGELAIATELKFEALGENRLVLILNRILKVARRRGEYHLDPSAVLPVGFASCYIPRKRHVSPAELDALLADLEAGKNCGVTTGAQRAAAVAFMAATGARLQGGASLNDTPAYSARRLMALAETSVRDGTAELSALIATHQGNLAAVRADLGVSPPTWRKLVTALGMGGTIAPMVNKGGGRRPKQYAKSQSG